MIESGYPGFISDTFNALFAPAGTPPEVVALLVKRSAGGDEAAGGDRGRAQELGYQIVAGSPEQMTATPPPRSQGVKELVARAGIKPEN